MSSPLWRAASTARPLGGVYFPAVSAVVWNRVNIVLCFLGIFVAGVLSLGYILNLAIPCGIGVGCDTVAHHPSSRWLGIPIAYFGFGMYAFLLALGVARFYAEPGIARNLLRLGFVVSLAGMLISIGLQVYSKMVIKEWCTWCIGSAIVITLLFLVHAMQLQSDTPQHGARRPTGDMVLLSLAGLLTLGGLYAESIVIRSGTEFSVDLEPLKAKGIDPLTVLLPPDAHTYGEPDAPLAIIEFGDLNCPLCQRMHPMIKDFVHKSNGKARYVFRHFPLFESKPFSLPAAILAEFAGEKGKFWEFVDRVYEMKAEQVTGKETYMGVLSGLGLNIFDAQKALDDTKSNAWNRMYRDRQVADKLGMRGTPIFFVVIKGQDPVSIPAADLMETLQKDRYQRVLKGDASAQK